MKGVPLSVICQQNAGAGAARNKALLAAETRFVAFLDADDEWLPDHLRVSLDHICENDLTLSAHNLWQVEKGREDLLDTASRLNDWPDPYVSLYCKGCIATSTVVVDRLAVIAAGGFDPNLANGQDVDLWLAILRPLDARFGIRTEALSRYYVSPDGINAQTGRRYRCYLFIAKRWAGAVYRRPAGNFRALWFRMAAIHFGAVQGFARSGEWLDVLLACLRLPWNLVHITASAFSRDETKDRDFLRGSET